MAIPTGRFQRRRQRYDRRGLMEVLTAGREGSISRARHHLSPGIDGNSSIQGVGIMLLDVRPDDGDVMIPRENPGEHPR